MKRRLLIAGFCASACVVGIALGQLACNSITFRDAIGARFERGHLLVLTHGHGIYEVDVQSEIGELRSANGEKDVDSYNANMERAILSRLIANTAAGYLARDETISEAGVDRECGLIQFQFRDSDACVTALAASDLSRRSLRSRIAANLRTKKWVERQLMSATKVTRGECAEYFGTHQQLYSLPARFRVSHLFLAAPSGSPPEIVDLKRRTIDSVHVRICHGESFSELVALTSEDEATKTRGGDLGFFSESRVPPDFFSTVAKMQTGETSPPVHTRLGFHIIQLADFKPARQMLFEEAEAEIRSKLENEKRRGAVESLTAELARQAGFMRASL